MLRFLLRPRNGVTPCLAAFPLLAGVHSHPFGPKLLLPPRLAMTSIKELKPDPRNARRRTSRSASLIAKSLEQFGAARSVVIDEHNRVLAGNGTLEGAKAAGIQKVRIVEADGTELIAVRRTGLSEQEKVGLAIADNRTSDLSEWDNEILAEISSEQDLDPWFTSDELAKLFGDKDEEDLAADQTDQLTETFSILITCTDEVEQAAALETLTNQGFQCRALNS